ncbi:hypothetical protein [Paractinoplanes atraurantiacus]|uniref:Uncharacterized protein n=1 Tax=Paractinoplanes atraurantiacus TaxID=1036182 RepID=A0A285HQA4_9ACTN|nr:hypothetical protein [Actinoplanes atraurantiacus]SNY37885.1 hypothetical protein SAMN05421748_105155 [Actinoplanes atraurantiacus]
MTLSVVYALETGHVVGALSSLGAPVAADAGPLVGPALPLRVAVGAGEPAMVSVPVRELAAHLPDDEPLVLTDPLAFGVEQPPKPALVRLRTWTNALSFTDAGLSVTIPTFDQVNATHVVAFVTEGPDTRMTSGDIKAGETTVVLPIAVENGAHGVLVLVSGWAGRLEAVTK